MGQKMSKVQSKTNYGPEFDVVISDHSAPELHAHFEGVTVAHRTDYWEDDSQTETYFLELTEEQYELVKRLYLA